MWVPVSPAVVAIASDRRVLVTLFWSNCALSLYCLLPLTLSQSCYNQHCDQILPPVLFSFKAELNFFVLIHITAPETVVPTTTKMVGCHAVWLQMSCGGKRGWKLFKLLFLLYCKRPASDPCLNCGWRWSLQMPSSEALNSEYAVDWFVEHVNIVTTFFSLAESRDVLEEMLQFGFPFNLVLKKSMWGCGFSETDH